MGTLAIEMSWFAVLNEKDIVEDVMQMPSSVTGPEFIKIPAEDRTLIGKKYNRETGEFEVPSYYYAELDEKGIVVEIITSPASQVKDNWITILSPDQNLIGKWYDKDNDRFINPPAFILAAHSTDEICYKHEDKWLSFKLDEMEAAITGCVSELSISQVNAIDIIAPKLIDLTIKDDGTFRLPPIEVLKLMPGTPDSTVTVKNVATDFEKNDCYEFGNVVKLQTKYSVPVQTMAFMDGYLSESKELDFKKIEKVAVM